MDLLKKYLKFCFTFKGRLNRKGHIFYIFGIGFAYFFLLLPFLLLPEDYTPPMSIIIMAMVFFLPLSLVTGIGGISCYVRRCNDFNWSGWWCFICMNLSNIAASVIVAVTTDDEGNSLFPDLLPSLVAIGVALVLYLIWIILAFGPFFIKGTKGENKYGPDPLGKI